MSQASRQRTLLLFVSLLLAAPSWSSERLVFGSFEQRSNASAFAQLLSEALGQQIEVATVRSTDADGDDLVWHRVVTGVAEAGTLVELQVQAATLGHRTWYWRSGDDEPVLAKRVAPNLSPRVDFATAPAKPNAVAQAAAQTATPRLRQSSRADAARVETEFDLGLQSRSYVETGQADQSRWQLSASGQFDWFMASADRRHSFTLSPFFRIDGEDDERTHFDLREAFYSHISDSYELHLGARQIFWGVTEFKHLVDVINQTDLVENIDGEDKLGQPMAQLSLSRNWGVLDLFLLAGARERTFAGSNGRLRFALPVDSDSAQYESSAEQQRVDGAVRWSHYAGPLSWGIYHFSGTNRDPLLLPRVATSGELELVPYYSVIDQSGLDAQLIAGDWAFKLEAISRSGDGDRYAAANLGFERTLVGVLGSRTDLGLVVEYLFDERGDQAHNTLFERDLAIGTRLSFNDAASSEALLGVIWDTETQEYVVSLEASRQIGQHWQLAVEGRAFSGAPKLNAAEQLLAFGDGSAKSAFLQSDDFLQLELTRFF
ncbi:MAG: hypothetical protein ACR2PZ_05560 [Pseudomonadales bacterium]